VAVLGDGGVGKTALAVQVSLSHFSFLAPALNFTPLKVHPQLFCR